MLAAMSAEPESPLGLEATRQLIRELVEARRASGEYPDDLERWLDRHYTAIVGSVGDRRHVLEERLHELRHLHIGSGRVVSGSRLPLGDSVHALVGKAVTRQTAAIYQQMHEIVHAVDAALSEVVAQMPTVDVRALETRIRDLVLTLAEMADNQQALQERLSRLEAQVAAADSGAPPKPHRR